MSKSENKKELTGVFGKVVNIEGSPVINAAVTVTQGTSEWPELAYRTDSEGEFHVPLPPGTFEISVQGPEGDSGSESVVIDSKNSRVETLLELL